MTAVRSRRGQPLVVLAGLIGLWFCLRMVMWESPFPALKPDFPQIAEAVRPAAKDEPSTRQLPAPFSIPRPGPIEARQWAPQPLLPANPLASPLQPSPHGAGADADIMASHQLMYLAALRRVPVPREVAHLLRQSANIGSTAVPAASPRPAADRWSLDAWLFGRAGRAPTGQAAFPASYGASQVGGVLRYRLRPDSAHRPTAYLRLAAALEGPSDREAALGLSARPIRGVPVSAMGEVRVRQGSGRTEVRPAAMAVTELDPLELPLGVRAESYAQAGYVGGDFETPFVDGQLRVTRQLAEFDVGKLRVGGGSWGGAQKGAARLDLGPTATLDVRLGETPARLAVDYRMRVAGDANPGSGMAVTLSTGF